MCCPRHQTGPDSVPLATPSQGQADLCFRTNLRTLKYNKNKGLLESGNASASPTLPIIYGNGRLRIAGAFPAGPGGPTSFGVGRRSADVRGRARGGPTDCTAAHPTARDGGHEGSPPRCTSPRPAPAARAIGPSPAAGARRPRGRPPGRRPPGAAARSRPPGRSISPRGARWAFRSPERRGGRAI